MSNGALVSFIIPTHNRHEMLDAAIASVFNQTLFEWELIIVDDGSDPAVESVITYQDDRISVFRNETPLGAAASRNIGAKAATSEFIAFLDDDDTVEPRYAQCMLELFLEHGQKIGFGWPALKVIDLVEHRNSTAQELPCLILDGSGTEASYTASGYVRTTGMFFRTSAFLASEGFDESLPVSEDRELVFRLLSDGVGCGAVVDQLVNFYVHAGPRLSTDSNLQRQADCDTRILERHQEFILSHRKLASRYLNLLAKRQKLAGWRQQYEQTLKLLLRIKPFDFRALRRLVQLKLGFW